MRASDLAGQRFGRLTAVRKSENRTPGGRLRWVCLCDCGASREVQPNNLKFGSVQSCGCIAQELNRAGRVKKQPLPSCSVTGCDQLARKHNRTLCGKHGKRQRLYGDVNYITPKEVSATRLRDAQLRRFPTVKPTTYRKYFGRHEHRVIGEKLAGRPLRSDEHVHHRDENKQNNDPLNLEVLTATEHLSLHAQKRKRDAGA